MSFDLISIYFHSIFVSYSFECLSWRFSLRIFASICCFSLLFTMMSYGAVSASNNSRAVSSSNLNSKPVKNYVGIVSKANGAITTIEDLKEAVRLTELMMGIQTDKSQEKRFTEEVLKEHIHEQLKDQCLAKFAQKTGWVSQKEVDATFADIAKRYHMSITEFEKFLSSRNIKKDTLLKRIKTEMSWVAYINARYGKDVNISENEAKKAAAEMEEKAKQESFFVSRMFFPVLRASEDTSVQAHASNILQMLNCGADFANIARQFSKSADAKNGGALGWIFEGQLSDAEIKALKEMSVGSYKIVKNERGYAILFLQDKKNAGPKTYSNVKFRQVVYPFEERPTKEGMQHLLDYISDMKKSSKNCQEFIQKAQDSGIMGVSDEASGTLESMIPEYRSVVARIPSGGIGEPIITDKGIVLVCLLEKETKVVKTPTAEEIRIQKTNERLGALSERELRGLIKKASIFVDKNYSLGADYSTADSNNSNK